MNVPLAPLETVEIFKISTQIHVNATVQQVLTGVALVCRGSTQIPVNVNAVTIQDHAIASNVLILTPADVDVFLLKSYEAFQQPEQGLQLLELLEHAGQGLEHAGQGLEHVELDQEHAVGRETLRFITELRE